jgi:hypothetical protein
MLARPGACHHPNGLFFRPCCARRATTTAQRATFPAFGDASRLATPGLAHKVQGGRIAGLPFAAILLRSAQKTPAAKAPLALPGSHPVRHDGVGDLGRLDEFGMEEQIQLRPMAMPAAA